MTGMPNEMRRQELDAIAARVAGSRWYSFSGAGSPSSSSAASPAAAPCTRATATARFSATTGDGLSMMS